MQASWSPRTNINPRTTDKVCASVHGLYHRRHLWGKGEFPLPPISGAYGLYTFISNKEICFLSTIGIVTCLACSNFQ